MSGLKSVNVVSDFYMGSRNGATPLRVYDSKIIFIQCLAATQRRGGFTILDLCLIDLKYLSLSFIEKS